jgi:predicted Zn-dependent protease with MMP-like domain
MPVRTSATPGSSSRPSCGADRLASATYAPTVTFEDVLRMALDDLPIEIAAALANVAVVLEDENPDDPDLYGLFEGVPLIEGGPQPGDLPNRIAVYRRPLEEDFPDPDELRREIRITVLHELGHAIGLDEDRLDELGYA